MYPDKTYRSSLRRYALFAIFFFFIVFIFSCKTGQQRSVPVRSSQKNYKLEDDLLEDINKLNKQGKYAQAISKTEELCRIYKGEEIKENQKLVQCLNGLGGLYNSFGDYEKAEIKLKYAYKILEQSQEKDNLEGARRLAHSL